MTINRTNLQKQYAAGGLAGLDFGNIDWSALLNLGSLPANNTPDPEPTSNVIGEGQDTSDTKQSNATPQTQYSPVLQGIMSGSAGFGNPLTGDFSNYQVPPTEPEPDQEATNNFIDEGQDTSDKKQPTNPTTEPEPEPEPEPEQDPLNVFGGNVLGNLGNWMDMDIDVGSMPNVALGGIGGDFSNIAAPGTPGANALQEQNNQFEIAQNLLSSTNPFFDTAAFANIPKFGLSDEQGKALADSFNQYINSDQYATELQSFIDNARANGVSDFYVKDSELTQRFNEAKGLTNFANEDANFGVRFNPDTGAYEYWNRTGDQTVGNLTKAIVGGAFTMGLGSALAPMIGVATGLGTAGSSALSSAIVNGTVTGLQGGDVGDILRSATLSGISGYASGVASELENANSALAAAQAAGDTAQVAELTNQIRALESVVNTATNAENIAQFANAVDQGANPIQAAAQFFGSDIAEFIDIDDTLNAGFTEIFNKPIADALTNDRRFTALLLDQAAGRNLGDALADRYGQVVVDQLDLGTKNGDAFALGTIEALAEYGENGVARDALFRGIKEYIDQEGDAEGIKEFLGNLVPNMPELGEGSDFGWIEDGLRQLGRDFDDSILQPVKNFLEGLVPNIDLPNMDLPNPDLGFIEDAVKEGAGVIQDEVLTPIEDNVLKPAEDLIKDGAGVIQDEVLTPIEDNILKPTEDAIKDGAEFVQDEVLTPIEDNVLKPTEEFIKDLVPELPDGPDLDLPDGPDFDLPDVDLPNVDLTSLLGLLGGAPSTAGAVGSLTPDEIDLVELGDLFDLDTMTLLGILENASADDELKRRNYNQGGIVSQYSLDELIDYLEGN